MKRLFVLFLIVLLPLRGWAGDLMGIQMARGGAVANVVATMAPDCPLHAQLRQQAAEHGDQAGGVMKACASCDLCLPLAALACAQIDIAVPFAAQAKPLMGVADFVSAPLALADKPPIF